MLTDGASPSGASGSSNPVQPIQRARSVDARKVVIVNGTPAVLELLEQLPEASRYDVCFVESTGHAYSQIKHVHPDLVILCASMDDTTDLQVLSMLKLDEQTRDIPVVTCALELLGDSGDEEETEDDSGGPAFAAVQPALMN